MAVTAGTGVTGFCGGVLAAAWQLCFQILNSFHRVNTVRFSYILSLNNSFVQHWLLPVGCTYITEQFNTVQNKVIKPDLSSFMQLGFIAVLQILDVDILNTMCYP